MADRLVVLDANVLIPSASRDTLLRAAEVGMYRPRWSVEILAEVERNLVKHGMTSQAGALGLIAALNRSFPNATVRDYAEISKTLTNHPKDRHVLAAAIQANADNIITDNLSDFPDSALRPHGILALSGDEFLVSLFRQESAIMTKILQKQASALRDPPLTIDEVLHAVSRTAPRFAELVGQRIKGS